MPSHPLDYEINPHVFSTPELTAIFDEKARYQRWLDIESALAKVQGELDIIPKKAAQEIQKKARLEFLDLDGVRAGYGKSKNSLIPLINGLRKSCKDNYGEYVHYGATTQDVIDTSESMEIKETFKIVLRDLQALEKVCLDLAVKHRKTPMVARTHGQQALPTTFGLKVAVWLSEINRHIGRAHEIMDRGNKGQLGGAVGTMAALGPRAMDVGEKTMEILGLVHHPLAWHNSRDYVGEVAAFFSLILTTLTKMANEVFELQKTEMGELAEPSPKNALASSTMPHKKNPVICERIVVLSCHVRNLSATIMESLSHEHERDARRLWSEWLAVPQLCIYTGSALHYMLHIMSGLEVYTDRMLQNLNIQRSMVASEWLLFRLSSTLGKMRSLEKIHDLTTMAKEKAVPLGAIIKDDPHIGPLLSAEDYHIFEHPEEYIGHAVAIVDRVVEEIRQKE